MAVKVQKNEPGARLFILSTIMIVLCCSSLVQDGGKVLISEDDFASLHPFFLKTLDSFQTGPFQSLFRQSFDLSVPEINLLRTMLLFGIGLVILEEVIFKPCLLSILPLRVSKTTDLSNCARYLSDGVAMLVFAGLGYHTLWKHSAGWGMFTNSDDAAVSSVVRMYDFHPVGLQICALQVAYEVKSLTDVVAYGDGALFFTHHVLATSLALFAFAPYCQLYGVFFLGISEVSTFILCLLVNFDDERGLKYFRCIHTHIHTYVIRLAQLTPLSLSPSLPVNNMNR